ncbi:DUF3801 domain-containing protein (plasmid) [Leifsonia sp. ZF2019]|uniref:DUF3801 domain-containing protein n=1 Tax=Leifsonia sp. ZF2019 TaxID=2781978 RepID=UPI001CBE5CF5|nr:DUF3801 domain-containing protein [Leifsonia sp. ZF2019]UAJ81709.1 DUF3801 domain-containing protein [Leifsonia sp. ZF2019]
MDLIDKVGSEAQQLASQTLRLGVSTVGRFVKLSVRLGVGTGQQSLRAIGGLLAAAKDAAAAKREEGQVGLRQFTRLADSKREVVGIKDSDVARQLARELRRHGVLFSIEAHQDGTRSFHVQGKDAALIEHALTVASTRVDEKLASRDTSKTIAEETKPGERTLSLTAEQRDTLGQEIRSAGLDDLANQVERDSAITLSRENVTALDRAFTEKGWQVSSLEEAPEQLREVVIAVDEERVSFESQTLDETPSLERAAILPDKAAPAETVPQPQETTQTATVTERTTTKQSDPQMSKRDATRKRVGDRIEATVATKKKELTPTTVISRERPQNLGRK